MAEPVDTGRRILSSNQTAEQKNSCDKAQTEEPKVLWKESFMQ